MNARADRKRRATAHKLDGELRIKERVTREIPDSVDVAIVGCGLGGLTAGAYLASRGARVACFDHHYVAGGCATQFGRGHGDERYYFDIGLHYIGDCAEDGMIPQLLRGVDIEIDYVPMDSDGFDELIFPDLRFRIPVGRERYRDRLVDQFPEERKGIDKYVRFLEEVDRIAKASIEARGKQTLGLLAKVLLRGRTLVKYQNATMAQVLDDCTDDPRLRAVILGQHGDYGLPPSKVSAVLHAGLANHYFKGAYYPKGGGQVIADELANRIEDLGGTVHLRHGIQEILIEDGAAVGVRTEPFKGESHVVRAKAVLSNADIVQTFQNLVAREHLPNEYARRVDDFEMGGAIFMTCLGVTADMRDKGMGATNYWQFDAYDVESFYRAIAEDGTLEAHGCYITSASLKDPDTSTHAPEGVTNIEVMTILPGDAQSWDVPKETIERRKYRRLEQYETQKARLEEEMIDRLEALFPGTRETIVFRESATPITHTRYTRATDGTGYGLAATPEQFLQRRPGYRTPIDGLFLCGASTRAGHGVVGAMTSGHHAHFAVSKHVGVSVRGS